MNIERRTKVKRLGTKALKNNGTKSFQWNSDTAYFFAGLVDQECGTDLNMQYVPRNAMRWSFCDELSKSIDREAFHNFRSL